MIELGIAKQFYDDLCPYCCTPIEVLGNHGEEISGCSSKCPKCGKDVYIDVRIYKEINKTPPKGGF
jgi:hypothetical protein